MLFLACALASLYSVTVASPTAVTQYQRQDQSCRSFPGDCSWPSPSVWDSFNKTIGGRLVVTVPIASPCHDDGFRPYSKEACDKLRSTWYYPKTHYSTSSSVMAEFFANMSCDPFTAPQDKCAVGAYVQYAVDAASLDDYKKTIAFVDQRNIRLVIRNTGHDYFGKSTGAGALALWTHHLKDISVLNYSSPRYTGKAMRLGAGVQSFDAFSAADTNGLVVVGGNCDSVGVAGGYTQGGGHSLLASTFGLSADQVLEWEVITAAGKHVIASPFSNSDLYWALSGGGGGTFAAVYSIIVKAYPDFKVAAANLTFTAAGVSHEVFMSAVQTWLQSLPSIVDAGASTLWTLADGFFQIAPVFAPGMTAKKLQKLLKPTLANLDKSGIAYTSSIREFPTFLDAYREMNPPTNVTGANLGGRLLPRSFMTSDSSASALTDTLGWLVNGTGAITAGLSANVAKGAKATNAVDNSVNPAWRSSIHNAVFGLPYDVTNYAANIEAQKVVTDKFGPKLDALLDSSRPPSSYLNEADFRQPNWQDVFYGPNYPKLLSIKDKYDPSGLFYGLTAVGSERWESRSDGRLCRL